MLPSANRQYLTRVSAVPAQGPLGRSSPAAPERTVNDLQRFNDFDLKAKARIWTWLPYLCHVHSTADPSPSEANQIEDSVIIHPRADAVARPLVRRMRVKFCACKLPPHLLILLSILKLQSPEL